MKYCKQSMAINGNHQSAGDVFQSQPKALFHPQTHGDVLQDKARTSSARVASPQPAAVTKTTRAHQLNPNSARSHPLPKPHQRAEKVTAWTDPIVKAELQRIAAQEGLSLSATTSALLKQALQQHVDMHYSALLTPIIETAIDKRMRSRDSRLAWLLVRVAFDTGQTRAIVNNILARQPGVTEEDRKTILDMSQKTAKANITRKTPQLTELIAAVEKWLSAESG